MLDQDLQHAHANMVLQQIRPWEVLDSRTLEVMNRIPRDEFVPPQYRNLAYADIEIPLGRGQHMMFPRVEARLLQALSITPDDNILEIGTGSGFLTACLASLGGQVKSLDIYADFTDEAKQKLQDLGLTNTHLLTADGLRDEVEDPPFDVIAITGSLPVLPTGVKNLLSEGGRMFVVIGDAPVMEACLVTRVGDTAWRTETLFETSLTPLINTPPVDRFQF